MIPDGDIPPRFYGPLIEPLNASLLGARPVHGTQPSDHYALQADIRY